MMSDNHDEDDHSVTVGREAEYERELPEINLADTKIGPEYIEGKVGAGNSPTITEYQAKMIVKLSQIGLTLREINAVMGIAKSVNGLHLNFGHLVDQGTSRGNYMLRRRQFEVAMAGDTRMLIHLGRVRLGQIEQMEIATKGILPWGDDKPKGATDDML